MIKLHTPDWSPDPSDTEEDFDPDGAFENNLYQVITMCLNNALIAARATESEPDSDTNILRMNDEELAKTAADACNELVYGEYDTGHIGFIQQYRDMGTITRLSAEEKERMRREAAGSDSEFEMSSSSSSDEER